MRLHWTLPVVCLATLIAGCERLDLTATDAPTLQAGRHVASAGAADLPDTIVVDVADYTYTPNYMTLKLGGTVRWHFHGPKGHSVEDVSGLGQYDSGLTRAGVLFDH